MAPVAMRFLSTSLALLLTASVCFGQAFTLHRPYVGRAAVDPDLVLLIDLAYYWPFNATRETNYVTGTLPEFPGSPSTLVGLTNGIWGTAAYFDNTARNISIPINFWTNTWTCSFWFRPEAMGANGVVMGTYTSPDVWFLQVKDATTLKLAMYDNLAGYNEIDQTVALNTWYFFCFGYNSTNNTVWMQNNDNPRTTLTMAHAIRGTTTAVTVSGGIPGTPGRFDECAIWSRELTTNEVTMLETDGICQYLGTNCTAVPFIITQPSSVVCDTNAIERFHLVALGGRQDTYRWQSNGVDLVDNAMWSGSWTPDLWITNNGTLFTNLPIQCLVTNPAGSVTSSPVTLTTIGTLTNNLVLWWKFDEGAGLVANDSSGLGNTGNLSNSPVWTATSHYSNALYFNGSSQWVVKSNATSVPTGNSDRTFACWAMTTNASAGIGQYAMSSGYPNANTAFLLGLNQNHFVVTTAGAANDCTAAATATAGTWYHFVGTYSGGIESLYLNGAFVTNKNITTTATSDANSFAAKHATGQNWGGYVDDVRIYSRVLTTNEIGLLYQWIPSK